VLLMTIDDGSPMGLRPDVVLVRLVIETKWAKEITAWNTCSNAGVGKLTATQTNGAPVSLRVFKFLGGTSTLVFRKPKFAGWWTDLFHFDPQQFWTVLGGKVVTFTWKKD
jgi:hypothetical protein